MRSIHTRMGSIVLALMLTAGVAAAAVVLPAEPVALLVKFEGDVNVQRADAETSEAGAVGMQLVPGDQVVVAAGSEAVVLYKTGQLVKAASTVTIEAVETEESSSLFTNTLRTLGQVASTDARTQPNRQGMIRPIAGAPVPIAPRNRIKVLDVRPTFTWFSVDGTSEYMIQLQRQGADSPAPVRFQVGEDTTWTLPLTEPPLVPGATYVWTVGSPAGRVAEPKRFTVASAEDIAAVQEAMTNLIGAGIDPATDGLFLTALAYRDAGLFYEAHRAIAEIEENGNGTGRAFFMLKGEVLDTLGMVDAAARAFDRAEDAP
ncbi:MAG: hypothetical protein R6U63_12380 [Longimicrobiales bacterium]